MQVILAGPEAEELARTAYPAFAAAGLDVAAVTAEPEELADLAGALPDGVAVVQVNLYPSPEAAVEELGSLPCRVAVVLPRWWEGERERFAALPNLLAGFTGPVSWAQVAAEVKGRAGRRPGETAPPPAVTGTGERPGPGPKVRAPSGQPSPPGGPGRVVAVWSGPMGGVGKTTLALLLAAYGAEHGLAPLLLALAEPGLSAYLGLARAPNATAFFETGDLDRAVQRVGWASGPSFPVVLGPARPRDGAVEREQVAALVEKAGEMSRAVVMDLPALVPGGNVWSLEPLLHAGSVLLVAAPTRAGVAAAVEGLATLRDIGAPGRALLVVNRRGEGGLPLRSFVEGVQSLWGDCPQVVEVSTAPDLAAAMDRGELPDGGPLLEEAVARLAEAALGLPLSLPKGREAEKGTGQPPRRAGRRLIHVEVVD